MFKKGTKVQLIHDEVHYSYIHANAEYEHPVSKRTIAKAGTVGTVIESYTDGAVLIIRDDNNRRVDIDESNLRAY